MRVESTATSARFDILSQIMIMTDVTVLVPMAVSHMLLLFFISIDELMNLSKKAPIGAVVHTCQFICSFVQKKASRLNTCTARREASFNYKGSSPPVIHQTVSNFLSNSRTYVVW